MKTIFTWPVAFAVGRGKTITNFFCHPLWAFIEYDANPALVEMVRTFKSLENKVIFN
jgi:hypothetical protein